MRVSRAFALAAIAAGALWAQQPVYHVTDLGTLTGTTSAAAGISQNGTYVTGTFNTPGTQPNTAFLWSSAAGAVSLGTLAGASTSTATGVNNSGQVSGYSVPNGDHAFLYSGGTMTDLGTLGTGTGAASFGLGLNNLGSVVGYSNPQPVTNFHLNDGFLYSGGTMQDLGLPPGASTNFGAAASGINDSGLIIGYYTPDSATTRPFTLLNGTYTDLGTLAGKTSGINASANYVSSNGLVAGYSYLADATTIHAFLYNGSTMQDLGTLGGTVSRGIGVNSHGDVVGVSTLSASGFHGFLYHGGTMLNLNNLLDAASAGYTITTASGISEGGLISATGSVSGGTSHALLLTPVSVSPQTISFDAIPNQIFGISPFPIAAQASSGLPVTIASTTPAVCKNASGLVTLLSAGPCSLTASQSGNINFSPATSVIKSFTVSQANPSGTLQPASGSPFSVGTEPRGVAVGYFNGSANPGFATANYNDGTVTVLASNNSGGFTAVTGSPYTVGTNPQSVAVGDFNADGYPDLAVANSGSDNVTVLLGSASGAFTALAGGPITVGTQPVSIVVGDFNADGIQDLAVANFSSNNVTILLGNGSGGFTATVSPLTVGTHPLSLAVGDFNRDGSQDLAVANFGDGTVTVLLGSTSGAFSAATNSPFTVGSNPYSVAVGDFDGDGKPDLATANSGSNDVTVLQGDGLGGFTPFAQSPFTVGTNPYSVVVADLNGDGIPDIAAANFGGSNVAVLIGNGSGGFSPAAGGPFAAGTPFSLAVADFNGDGILDLASANYAAGKVDVLLGGKVSTTSTLSTISPSIVALGQTVPLTLAVSDNTTPFAVLTETATFLDGNTTLGTASQNTSPYTFSTSSLTAGSHTLSATYGGDTRTLGSTSNTITIQVSGTLSEQTITFGALANQILGTTPPALSATASSGLTVKFASNTGSVCTVSGTVVTLVSIGTCSITASQDGNSQYAPALPVIQTFTVLTPQTITFDAIPNQIFGISPLPTAASASSGLPVTFVSTTPTICSNASSLIMLLKPGTCSITASQSGNASYGAAPNRTRSFTVSLGPSAAFTTPQGNPFSVGTSPNSIAVVDFKGDGILGLAVANQGSNNVTVIMRNLAGVLAPGSPINVGKAPSAIAAGDFNGDGKADLAVANFTDGTVTVLLGDGSGGFSAASGSPITVGKQPSGIAVGDFNDDGVQDLAVANNKDGTVTVLLGDGSGGFTPAPGSPITPVVSAKAIAVGDFNGDGIQDLAVGEEAFAAGTLTVLIGNGSGGFTPASYSPLSGGYLLADVAVGDFNGDGVPDLTASSLFPGANLAVLLGKKSGGFSAATHSPFTVGSSPLSVVVGDFNGDGFADIASANSGSGNVTLLLGDGSGGFTPAVGNPFTVGSGPGSGPGALTVGDFNNDGIEDLAVANSTDGTVTILLGGTLPTTSLLSTTAPATIFVDQSVPLTLTVSITGTPFSPLTGTATFLDGITTLGTATQTGSPYSFTATLAPGNHTLSATYGAGNGSPSTSNTIEIAAFSRCDINRDQATDVADIQLAVNEALGVKQPGNDLDNSGVVNVVEAQIIINATIGHGCSAATI